LETIPLYLPGRVSEAKFGASPTVLEQTRAEARFHPSPSDGRGRP
jgi:hypothetical protein